ncbi:MAG TPA: 2-dehydropantoate 2-reductase [Anaerolineales bacterium]|nr:2-dehydropantoate 2-reductase [Anaerolineales bacterium]
MRYLVYGAGAVGAFIGGRLSLAGQPVAFLARRPIQAALRQSGLHIAMSGNTEHLHDVACFSNLSEALGSGLPDVILLTVKSYDAEAAARAIHAAWADPPPVVCLQNGVGNEAALAKMLGQGRVLSATLTSAVQMPKPGLLRVERARGLGLAADHSMAKRLFFELSQAGLRPRLYNDADRMKWSKLLTNIVANAVSAIVGWRPGDVLGHAGLFRLEVEALREAVRVMRALGLAPQNLPGVPVGLLGRGIFLPTRLLQAPLRRIVSSGRGGKLPSFQHDIGRGRSEVVWLNGAVARVGEQHHVPTPANAFLTQTLMALVMGQADPSQYRDRPEVLLRKAQLAGVGRDREYNPAAG